MRVRWVMSANPLESGALDFQPELAKFVQICSQRQVLSEFTLFKYFIKK